MDKKIAAMDLTLSHIGMDVPEKTVREMADIFLHALADDLPDEMVERGARAHCDHFGGDGWYDSGQHPESKNVLLGAASEALQAALKGAA